MYFVEYSNTQKCFHINDIETMIEQNRKNALENGSSDYFCIGMYFTYEQAEEFIKKFKKRLEERKERC